MEVLCMLNSDWHSINPSERGAVICTSGQTMSIYLENYLLSSAFLVYQVLYSATDIAIVRP